MPNEIEGVVASLRSLDRPEDVNQAYATVDRWNREKRTGDLLELAAAIEQGCDVAGEARIPFEAVADHVEEVLALTPGSDHVEGLLALLAQERVRSVQRPRPREMRVRAFASRLGHGQTKDALNAAILRLGDKKAHAEVLACWVHELVLRGTSLDREPAVVDFHARLTEDKHPLAALPLTMLGAESEAPTYMPMYGASAISKAVARLESGPQSTRTIPPPGEHAAPRTTRVENAALEGRLREAVVPWTIGSNGKAEAKVFRLDPVLDTSPGRWLLRALPLDCVVAPEALHAERTGADAVWGSLFAAAANGGVRTPCGLDLAGRPCRCAGDGDACANRRERSVRSVLGVRCSLERWRLVARHRVGHRSPRGPRGRRQCGRASSDGYGLGNGRQQAAACMRRSKSRRLSSSS
jgi:hypothetical protein